MAALVTGAQVEECLRVCLAREGYELSRERGHGETGVDIEAKKDSITVAIEVIGFKASPPGRATDFFQSFFRAVSRLNNGADFCVIALPVRFSQGLPARANQYRVAWSRIAKIFPELEIWLVDTEKRSYARSKWGDWIKEDRAFSQRA